MKTDRTSKLLAKDIMSSKLVTVGMNDSLQKAFQLMEEHHFRHLPVIDERGEFLGILSDRDFQRALKTHKQGIEIECEVDSTLKALDLMSWPALVMSDEVCVSEIAQKMLESKISAVLVSSGGVGRVRGLVTTDDLLRLLVVPPEGATHTSISSHGIASFGQKK